MLEVQTEYLNIQNLFKTLLLNIKDLADDQISSWKTYLESVRDYMTSGASKSDEILTQLYTDITDLTYNPAVSTVAVPNVPPPRPPPPGLNGFLCTFKITELFRFLNF